MKLNTNQTAPNFETLDIYGKKISLSEFKGHKVLLGFFRNVNCPFCNLRVHELLKLKEKLDEKNFKMIFLFESKPNVLKMSIFHQEISPIPLIGDPEKIIYNQFGVEKSLLKMVSTFFQPGIFADVKASKALNLPEDKDASVTLMPADFLVDENGKIVKAYYGSNLRDHISMQEIKNFAGI